MVPVEYKIVGFSLTRNCSVDVTRYKLQTWVGAGVSLIVFFLHSINWPVFGVDVIFWDPPHDGLFLKPLKLICPGETLALINPRK